MASEAEFIIEYSKTGRSACKYKKCEAKAIEKSALRIGKRFPSERFTEGGVQTDWYHPACVFKTFIRARATSRKINSEADLEGFSSISAEDQAMVKKLIKEAVPTYSSGSKSPKKPKQAKIAASPFVIAPAPSNTDKKNEEHKEEETDVSVVSEDGSVVWLMGNGPNFLGRSEKLGVKDRRCSRKQVEITRKGSKHLKIKAIGQVPCCLYRDSEPPIVMAKDTEYEASEGDQFTLMADKFSFTIHFGTKPTDEKEEPPNKKRAKEENDTDEDEKLTAPSAPTADSDEKPLCPYGEACYRKNPEHFREYRHLDKKTIK